MGCIPFRIGSSHSPGLIPFRQTRKRDQICQIGQAGTGNSISLQQRLNARTRKDSAARLRQLLMQ